MGTPRRTCVGCRRVDDQDGLVRLVVRDQVVTPDPARTLPGRGAWLHASRDCLDEAVRRGAFARSFRRRAEATVLLERGWPDGGSGG